MSYTLRSITFCLYRAASIKNQWKTHSKYYKSLDKMLDKREIKKPVISFCPAIFFNGKPLLNPCPHQFIINKRSILNVGEELYEVGLIMPYILSHFQLYVQT